MKITFTDKTSIDNRPDLSDIEKITGGNINEIKEVVNANEDELDATKVKVENINTSLENFNKEVESLKENDTKQDEKIEYLEKEAVRLRQDIQASQLTGEAEGESIDLDDSSGARFKKFGVGGNHSQETREGYNLLDMRNAKGGTSNGITCKINADGSVKYTGTATSNAINVFFLGAYGENAATLFTLKPGTYYIKDVNLYNKTIGINPTKNKYIWTIEEETNVTAVRAPQADTGKTYNKTIYPIVSLSNKAVDYEQYGATPSLEFPSEIKTVKDNVNLTVANKNYINIENTSKTINGITFTVNSDGSILANGTATDRASYPIQNNFKKFEAGQYFVSGCPSGGSESTYYLILWNENWVSMGSEYGKGKLVSLSNQKVKLHINIMKGTVCNNLLFKPQMEKGTKATDYEAHQEQAITMPVQQEMLEGDYFDWKNEKQTNLFEKIVLNGVDKKCTTSKAVGDGSEFQWAFTVAQSLPYVRTVYSNVAKLASDFGTVNGIRISANSTTAYVRSKIEVLNGKEATVENVNELLKTMYDNGNPAIFYIEKASNKELDFTDEQKAVAKKIKETLHTYKNITHIYSTDETSPIMNVEYAKDLNTTINNIQALVINNASEEVNG